MTENYHGVSVRSETTMTDDLKAPERTFDHPYELSHSDGEWWTLKSNGFVVASFSLKTWGSAERIIEAAWQYAYGQPDTDRIANLEAALADMTQQRDAAMAGAVRVKPLVWVKHPSVDIWRADTAFGTYKVFGLGPTQSWDFDSFSDLNDKTSKSAESVTAAKAAAQADYNARILSALTPDPDRMLALTAAAYEDAAKEIDCGGCYGKCLVSGECHAEMALDIRALTPSDALAALSRIEAQAESRGMRKAAEIAEKTGTCLLPSGHFLSERCRDAILSEIAATEAAAKGGV